MMEQEIVVVVKVGGVVVFGLVIVLWFLFGSWWQWMLLFVSSFGIGCLVGGVVVECFVLVLGFYMYMLVVVLVVVFGLVIVNNVMQQILEIFNDVWWCVIGGVKE